MDYKCWKRREKEWLGKCFVFLLTVEENSKVGKKDFYSIYRVYFVRNGVVVYMLNNIHKKQENRSIQVVPTMYRVDFSNDAVDAIME